MTAIEQDTAFFSSEEAKRIQQEWEPKFGDLALVKDDNAIVVVSRYGEYEKAANSLLIVEEGAHSVIALDRLLFLPRPDQLWAMLEERGWHMSLSGRQAGKDYEYYVVIYNVNNYRIDGHGPTPSIALGRALIEVLEERE